MWQDALSVVQGVYRAFGRGDVSGLIEMLADDVVWAVEGCAGDYPTFGVRRGPHGVLEFFQALGATEDISTFEPTSFHPSGETVLVLGRVALTLKTNGRALAYDWAHVFMVRGGKVASFREFYDTAMVVAAYRA
jgi:ketosteroid isomerase-like protein